MDPSADPDRFGTSEPAREADAVERPATPDLPVTDPTRRSSGRWLPGHEPLAELSASGQR